jgi:hypothetical protein
MEAMREGQHEKQGHYGRLMLMTTLSFVAMFILMYAMVDRFANVYVNFNQVYAAPMVRLHGLLVAPLTLVRGKVVVGGYCKPCIQRIGGQTLLALAHMNYPFCFDKKPEGSSYECNAVYRQNRHKNAGPGMAGEAALPEVFWSSIQRKRLLRSVPKSW